MPILLSMEVKNFAVWDYVVFAALFIISSGIGVFYAIKERKKATSREFLVGGRQMSFGPVALSLTASFMSAVTVLGTPADVYRFGASFVLFFITYGLVIILTSELFLPVFYRSGITSTYEVKQLLASISLWEELLFPLHLNRSFYDCFFPLIHILCVLCLNDNTWWLKTLICRIIMNHGENLLQCYWGKLKLWTRTYLYAETATDIYTFHL